MLWALILLQWLRVNVNMREIKQVKKVNLLINMLVLLFPIWIIFFLSLVGFGYLDFKDNKNLIKVPVVINKLEIEKYCYRFSMLKFIQTKRDEGCLKAKYTYFHLGKEYVNDVVASSFFYFKKSREEEIKKYFENKRFVYVSSDKPSYSLLLNRQEYFNLSPTIPKVPWVFVIFFIPLCLSILIPNYLIAKLFEKTNPVFSNNLAISLIFRRLIAYYCDVGMFIYSVLFIITIFYDFSYFSKMFSAEGNLFFDFYIVFGLPIILFFSWLVMSRSLGMYVLDMEIVDVSTLKKPSIKQLLLRLLGNCLIIALGGIPFLLASFDKRKQTIADKLSNTLVVHYTVMSLGVDKRLIVKDLV